MIVVLGRVQNKRDTSANWAYVNPVLLAGEIGLDTTVNNFKEGDGATHWSDLPYWISGAGINVVQKSFTGLSNLTINWQTDIPTGETQTYAALLGNKFPRPFVYLLSTGTIYINPGTTPTIDYSAGLINTVTFDWGSVADGYIRF